MEMFVILGENHAKVVKIVERSSDEMSFLRWKLEAQIVETGSTRISISLNRREKSWFEVVHIVIIIVLVRNKKK